MSAEDEIRGGMKQAETQAARHADAQRREAAASVDRRRRANEIRAAIMTFLRLMRGHGYPGVVRILASSPNERPQRRGLFWQAPARTEVHGWMVSETLTGAEASAYLVVTVDGDLSRAHSESEGGPDPITGRWVQPCGSEMRRSCWEAIWVMSMSDWRLLSLTASARSCTPRAWPGLA